jgi:hypothetical protein
VETVILGDGDSGGQEDVEMLLLISGAIICGAVALAALYDSIARRRGGNVSISITGPFLGRPGTTMRRQDGTGRRRLVGDQARRPRGPR